jgi:hypothetical protein
MRHAGTAKHRVSRTRHRILWVGLWVGKRLPIVLLSGQRTYAPNLSPVIVKYGREGTLRTEVGLTAGKGSRDVYQPQGSGVGSIPTAPTKNPDDSVALALLAAQKSRKTGYFVPKLFPSGSTAGSG